MAIADHVANLRCFHEFENNFLDSSSNGNDITNNGITFETTSPLDGVASARGNGVDTYGDIDQLFPSNPTEVTISFKFKSDVSNTAEQRILSYNQDGIFIILSLNAGTADLLRAYVNPVGFTSTTTDYDVTLEHTLRVTAKNNDFIKFYVDGIQIGSSQALTTMTDAGSQFARRLFSGRTGTVIADGVGDRLAVWDAVIPEADMDLYEAGASPIAVDTTTVGVATATDGGSRNINVSMPYTDDGNANSTYTVDYKLSADSTYTNWVTASPNTPSPYTDTITGLVNAGKYDVQVTYNDADGVTGTNPQTITDISLSATPNKFIPTNTRNDFIYRVVKNTNVVKVVKKTHISKVVK